MWVSPIPKDILEKYNLAMIKCSSNVKTYTDVLIYRENYVLNKLDKLFIEELFKAKDPPLLGTKEDNI